jgi:Flp pilus assembly protein TadG
VTDRPARASGDRGAVLVEFAFVLPILAMLVFGLVSAGMAWNTNLAMASGARAGGRYAATLRTSTYTSMDDYLDAVEQRVVDSSEGSLATSVPGRVICVAYVHPAADGSSTADTQRSRTETGTTVTRSGDPCFTDNQTSTDTRIQISVQRTTTIETGIWSQNATLRQKVVFRYEVSSGL